MGVCAVDLSFLKFGEDSSFQNLAEFLGAILAVAGYIRLGHRGMSLALRGDSVTALTWAITERPRGYIVTNASMVWTLLCVAADVDVNEITHISGDDNHRCDRLSRLKESGRSAEQEAVRISLTGVRVLEVQEDRHLMTLLGLCDPRKTLMSEEEFIEFWRSTREAIDTFIAASPPTYTEDSMSNDQTTS